MQCKQLILWTIAVLLITACNTPLSNRIDNYVNEVENNCSNWTEDDWERSQSEYEKLLEEYQPNYDSYSQEERDAVNKAIGRYTGLLVRQGIEETGKLLKDFGERLPSLLEGFMSAFDENHTE